MPELPDVETFRRFLNRTTIGQTTEKIDVRDELIRLGVPSEVRQIFVNRCSQVGNSYVWW